MNLTVPKVTYSSFIQIFFSFLKDFIYSFVERGEGREKDRERSISVWLPLACPPTGDLACNPGMCPDWESICQPFGSQPTLNPLSYTNQSEIHFIFLLVPLVLEVHKYFLYLLRPSRQHCHKGKFEAFLQQVTLDFTCLLTLQVSRIAV